jgi:fructokinase
MYLVCGEALYDVFVDSISSDALGVEMTAKAGGSPYNVAVALSRLGIEVALATEIGNDVLGRSLDLRLQQEGVDRRFVRRTGKATPLALVDVDAVGKPRYVFYGLEEALFHPDVSLVQSNWDKITGIHVGSISIVSAPSSQRLIELVRDAPIDMFVSFDPNIRLAIEPDAARWQESVAQFRQYAHFIKVSEEDLGNLYGGGFDSEKIALDWLTHRCSLVAVTRGERGATYYSRSAGKIEVSAVSVVVADTVGAGDSFQAATLAWLAENRYAAPAKLNSLSAASISELGHFAASAAAATCSQRGPEFPYRTSLQKTV